MLRLKPMFPNAFHNAFPIVRRTNCQKSLCEVRRAWNYSSLSNRRFRFSLLWAHVIYMLQPPPPKSDELIAQAEAMRDADSELLQTTREWRLCGRGSQSICCKAISFRDSIRPPDPGTRPFRRTRTRTHIYRNYTRTTTISMRASSPAPPTKNPFLRVRESASAPFRSRSVFIGIACVRACARYFVGSTLDAGGWAGGGFTSKRPFQRERERERGLTDTG